MAHRPYFFPPRVEVVKRKCYGPKMGAASLRKEYPTYGTWEELRKRCLNPKHKDYYLYGGRGVIVCDRWKLFANFHADMGPKPTPSHSIDRIDNDGPYSPANCRWATTAEQAGNRRPGGSHKGTKITIAGVAYASISDACRRHGITYRQFRRRVQKYGLTIEEAISKPLDLRRQRLR